MKYATEMGSGEHNVEGNILPASYRSGGHDSRSSHIVNRRVSHPCKISSKL
jgi:hypothetical protein